MEFDHVGRHCALATCNQRDFLPFKCDYCHRDYCLEHRSYTCHGCKGAESKDFTSTDCPMCGKSIRFSKSQDPNLIWEEHYLHGCTQQPQQKVSKKCARSDCRTILGPSNTFSCPKCRQEVCIAHRFAEDHNCAKVLREARANALQSKISANTSSSKPSPSSSSTTVGAKKIAEASNENSLKGSAARRMANQSTNNISKASVTTSEKTSDSHYSFEGNQNRNQQQCPFLCGMSFADSAELAKHVNVAHNDFAEKPEGQNSGTELVRISQICC